MNPPALMPSDLIAPGFREGTGPRGLHRGSVEFQLRDVIDLDGWGLNVQAEVEIQVSDRGTGDYAFGVLHDVRLTAPLLDEYETEVLPAGSSVKDRLSEALIADIEEAAVQYAKEPEVFA